MYPIWLLRFARLNYSVTSAATLLLGIAPPGSGLFIAAGITALVGGQLAGWLPSVNAKASPNPALTGV